MQNTINDVRERLIKVYDDTDALIRKIGSLIHLAERSIVDEMRRETKDLPMAFMFNSGISRFAENRRKEGNVFSEGDIYQSIIKGESEAFFAELRVSPLCAALFPDRFGKTLDEYDAEIERCKDCERMFHERFGAREDAFCQAWILGMSSWRENEKFLQFTKRDNRLYAAACAFLTKRDGGESWQDDPEAVRNEAEFFLYGIEAGVKTKAEDAKTIILETGITVDFGNGKSEIRASLSNGSYPKRVILKAALDERDGICETVEKNLFVESKSEKDTRKLNLSFNG